MKHFKRITLLILMLLSFSININSQTATPRATWYYCGEKGMGWGLACGEKLNYAKACKVRYVAISRDLEHKGFKMGSYIKVKCVKYPSLNGVWRIMDRMAARIHNGIDFLLQSKKDRNLFRNPCKIEITLLNK